MLTYEHRHPSTQHMMQVLAPNENLTSPMADIAEDFARLAIDLVDFLPDSIELTAGLRKLLEAKDCMVRAVVFKENPNANAVWYTDR